MDNWIIQVTLFLIFPAQLFVKTENAGFVAFILEDDDEVQSKTVHLCYFEICY